MELEGEVLERVRTYESLSRWERSELGRDLRRLGLSYGEIMELIPVKKSTLATWCRDIELSAIQIEAIRQRRAQEPGVRRDTQWRRRREIEIIRERAQGQVDGLIGDPLWLAGVVLYWAEGGKTRNDLKIANSDPRTHRLFVRWIRTYIEPDAEFSLQLHLHEGNDELAARQHWQAAIGLHDARFHKSFIKPHGTGHRKNHLQHGICTLVVRRPADPWQITMTWVECIADRLGLPDLPN